MADGYARLTGHVGVCTLTHGPGLTNDVTSIAAADRDGVPLVILVGDTA
jgi:acetolactate synthase-1/2/3 large subunit